MTPENVRRFAGLSITNASESVNDGLCLGLYGQGGSGKTTVAAMITQSEHAGRALLCDADAGSSAIAHLGDSVDVTPVTKWAQLEAIQREVDRSERDELPYQTYIIDNMTEIMNMRILEVAGAGAIQIQHWGTCTGDMLRMTRKWRDLARSKGINVIFCVWEEREKDEETGYFSKRVFFTPKLAQAWPGIVTMVGHILPVKNAPEYRKISFVPTALTDSKFRVAPTETAAAIPREIIFRADQAVLADILNAIHGTAKWPTDKYVQKRVQATTT